MSSLVSIATGDFTSSSSWGVVDTTSELDSDAGNSAISTSNLDSATFTPGAITVSGIALKVLFRAASPSGTFTVTLRNSTGSVDVASVTINVSDLATDPYGWHYFKFASDQLLLAATAYLVRVVCSTTGSQVTLYRNGTANNWSRKLVTSTNAAPAANDHIVVSNVFTGAGASTAVTITMNNTATTSFGPTVSGGPPQGMFISGKGTMSFGTSASTNYYLRVKGKLVIGGGGILNIGTSGTRMPSTSTATLEMASVASNDSILDVNLGGTLNAYGFAKTSIRTTLTNTVSSAGTAITVGDTTDWAVSDELVFTPSGTNAAATTYEKKAISAIGSSTTATVAAMTNTHTVTAEHPCYVGNLTRNVKIKGITSLLGSYIQQVSSGIIAIDYVEFSNLGTTYGILCNGSGSASITNSSFQTFVGTPLCVNFNTLSRGFTFTGNIIYSHGAGMLQTDVPTAAGTARIISNNYFIGHTSSAATVSLSIFEDTDVFSGNVLAGKTNSTGGMLDLILTQNNQLNFLEANFTDNFIGYFVCSGMRMFPNTGTARVAAGIIKNLTVIEGSSSGFVGVYLGVANPITLANLTFENLKILAINAGYAFAFDALATGIVTINNGTFAGTTSRSQGRGLYITARYARVNLNNCNFGVVSGTMVAHATADIVCSSPVGTSEIIGRNTNLASTTKISGLQDLSGAAIQSYARFTNYGKTAGDHRSYDYYGTISSDSTIFNTATPSERITPLRATLKKESSPKVAPVNNASTVTVTVRVRKSVVGDGVAYNGNQPRLIQKQTFPTGITVDTVLATASAAAGSWETLTATTAAATENGVFVFVVDCDGTAGWINVDDWES